MNGNNQDNNGLSSAAGLAFAGAFVLLALFITVAAFIAAIMSIVCLMAWERPIDLFGHTLTPHEARGFIKRGLAGALIAPGFVIFASGFLQVPVRSDAWPYIVVGGYVIGSLIVGCFLAKAELEAAQQSEQQAPTEMLPPSEQHLKLINIIKNRPAGFEPANPAPDRSASQAEPFRFANWDDEEELRK